MDRRIEANATMRASLESARSILRSTPDLVFGDPQRESPPWPRTFHTTVGAQLGSDTTVERAVVVAVGPVHSMDEDGKFTAALAWEPIGTERFLPSFSGELSLDAIDGLGSRITVGGSYRVPLGRLGRFGDSVVGHRVARQSLALLVERVAERIDGEVIRQHTATRAKPAPYNEDLRPHSRAASGRA